MQEWIVPVALTALGVLVLVLVVSLARTRARTSREVLHAHAEAAVLRAKVEEIERRLQPPAQDPTDYVITRLGDEPAEPDPLVPPGRIDGKLFADIVARETAIKAAGLVHGLRRALAPETRNRIRFEMKREVQRARKQRRADLKVALREFRARGRADRAGPENKHENEHPRHDEGDAA